MHQDDFLWLTELLSYCIYLWWMWEWHFSGSLVSICDWRTGIRQDKDEILEFCSEYRSVQKESLTFHFFSVAALKRCCSKGEWCWWATTHPIHMYPYVWISYTKICPWKPWPNMIKLKTGRTSVCKEMERLGGMAIKDEEQHREAQSSSELRLLMKQRSWLG